MNELIQKAWKVVNSCQTHKQARKAIRYLELLAEAYPEIDVSPMRKELKTLFDLKDEGFVRIYFDASGNERARIDVSGNVILGRPK